jgi:predicted permease
MIENILPLLLIFSSSFFFKKKQIFQKQDGQAISKVLVNIAVPATIVNVLGSATITQRLLLFPLLGIMVVVAMLCIGYALSAVLHLPEKTKEAFIIAFPTLEGGTIGYALMFALFGKDGLVPFALFDLGNAACLFGLIFIIASSLGQGKQQVHPATGLLRLVKSPIIWAFVAGLLMNVFHIHVDALSVLVEMVSPVTLPLIMITLALECEPSFSSFRLSALTVVLKTGTGLLIGIAVTLLLHLRGVEQIAIIVGASLPASLLTLVYSSENNLDSQFVANLLSLAWPCALLFDTAIIVFLRP